MIGTNFNVILLSTRTFPELGGVAQHNYNLGKYSSNKKIKILNISPCPKGIKPSYNQITNNFAIQYLPIKNPGYHSTFFNKIKFIISFNLAVFRYLINYHKKKRIDIIITQAPHANALSILPFCKIFFIPYIYIYHALDYESYWEYTLDLKLAFSPAKLIMVISQRIYQILKYFTPNQSKNFYLLDNGINDNINSVKKKIDKTEKMEILKRNKLFTIQENNKIISYTGVMYCDTKAYGMVDFMKAFDLFLDESKSSESKNIYLLIVGDGEFKYIVNNAYKEIHHKDHIIITGFVKNLSEIYQISDLFALTSYMEGFPTVLLEAMSYGIPCIASNVGENLRIVGKTGYIVPVGDLDEMIKALMDFFGNDEKQTQLKNACLTHIQQFNWNIIGNNIRKMIILTYLTNYSKKKYQNLISSHFQKIYGELYKESNTNFDMKLSYDYKKEILKSLRQFQTKKIIRLG